MIPVPSKGNTLGYICRAIKACIPREIMAAMMLIERLRCSVEFKKVVTFSGLYWILFAFQILFVNAKHPIMQKPELRSHQRYGSPR